MIHPDLENDEMKSLAIDHSNIGSKGRQNDFIILNDEKTFEELKESTFQIPGWRQKEINIHVSLFIVNLLKRMFQPPLGCFNC